MTTRTVSKVVKGMATSDGGGVKLNRIIGGTIPHLDPFLLLDEFKSDNIDEYGAGFPDHPHRGFETITYMLAGTMEHKDHKGNQGMIGPGSIQWMTAGKGIIHSEMMKQTDGLLWGFQLWINLPSTHKMMDQRYQRIPSESVPEVFESNGDKVKVIAGKFREKVGPVDGVITNPLYLDVILQPGSNFKIEEIPSHHTTFIYMYSGSADFGPIDNTTLIPESHISVLDGSLGQSLVQGVAGTNGARFILIAAAPIGERIARQGPFVMTTPQELQQAFSDYQQGKF